MEGSVAPHRVAHKFTVGDVLNMIEAGVLAEKSRVELRGGELFDMPAEGARHSNVKSDLIMSVAAAIKGRYRMGADTPLRLADHEWPEPDLFVTPLEVRPAEATGESVLLVIEVADTSIESDLGEKARLYARHGVREYWVVDIEGARVLVHNLASGAYGEPEAHGREALVVARLAPEVGLRLSEIL